MPLEEGCCCTCPGTRKKLQESTHACRPKVAMPCASGLGQNRGDGLSPCAKVMRRLRNAAALEPVAPRMAHERLSASLSSTSPSRRSEPTFESTGPYQGRPT